MAGLVMKFYCNALKFGGKKFLRGVLGVPVVRSVVVCEVNDSVEIMETLETEPA